MWRSRAVFSKQTPRFSLLLEPVLKAQDSIYSTNRTDDWGYRHHKVTLGQGAKGEPFKVPIVKNVEIESENKICLGDMLLVEEADYNLLGRDLIVALGINLIVRNSQIMVSIYKLTHEDEDKINPKAIVAVALLVEEAKKITFGAPITVYTPHNVRTVLQQKAEKWLTDARLLKYEAILLHAPELELKTTQASNPAGFLFGEASSEPIHNCTDLIELQTKIREDLEDEELEEGEKWFVDGSARVIEEKRKSGYAIIDGKTGKVVKSGPLGTSWSAQACELYAVLQALKELKGKIGTIFTDSKYAFGVVHTFGKNWEERGLVNTRGKGLIHEDLIRQILKAVREPKAIAVVYVKSHQAGLQFRIRGNNLADQEARKAALLTLDIPESRTENPREFSPHPTEKEIEEFKKIGGILVNGKWELADGRELIPKAYARTILKRLHAQTHWGTQALAEQFLKFFGCKALLNIRTQPHSGSGLSPFEMLYGMPYEHGMPIGHPRVEDCQIQSYIVLINKNLQELRRRGLIAQSTPLGFAIHKIQPGDRVLIRAWKEAPLSSHWEGPFLVLLTTDTAVRTAEKGWTHSNLGWTQVKKVEQHSSSPQWKITSAPGDLKLRIHRDTQ
ncbi:hypothetical protein DUI87_20726 [Hirundo rustica rustica]|uniref:Gag-Pol polyprotein n=1 Tax=Hirundo rustica rustica TaxID=333673 RepID=A0A3M0K8R5_HIRRU|nr:hypothetical protein DUI87_20726 [Hirundo rustica rustica]